jgi:hypothetical protein
VRHFRLSQRGPVTDVNLPAASALGESLDVPIPFLPTTPIGDQMRSGAAFWLNWISHMHIQLTQRTPREYRMSATTKPPKAEQSRSNGTPLERRIRQQEILAELGVTALQGASFNQLLDDAARLTAEGMQAEFCKILEHIPAEKCFLVRAGVGWGPGIVGVATIGGDLASPAGFALRTGQPVIANQLENEERFRTPELLARYGIHRAMNVILQGEGRPFGVLEVDSRSVDEFSPHDIAFLQGAANLLGMAIERERYERSLKTALSAKRRCSRRSRIASTTVSPSW